LIIETDKIARMSPLIYAVLPAFKVVNEEEVIDATHIYAINATSWTEAILVVVDAEETSFDFFFFFS
jgi:hypothetical protein